jgi:hypothetical protein
MTTEPLRRLVEFLAHLGQVATGQVGEFFDFQRVPNSFIRVPLGRVAGQGHQLEPTRWLAREEGVHLPVPVDGSPIPAHDQRFGKMSLQMFQEPHYLCARERLFVALQEELTLRRHPADHRQMVPRERFLQHGGPSPRCVGADHEGQQIEPRLIDEDKRGDYARPL